MIVKYKDTYPSHEQGEEAVIYIKKYFGYNKQLLNKVIEEYKVQRHEQYKKQKS